MSEIMAGYSSTHRRNGKPSIRFARALAMVTQDPRRVARAN
jgi:hypothetical protein